MKKYHDQVIRNIYAMNHSVEVHTALLTSAALPAHCYVGGFKNLLHLEDVCYNEQNTSMRDLEFLTNEAIKLILARSAKQHHMPLKFMNFILIQLELLSVAFAIKDVKSAQYILNDSINELNADYGWDAQRAAMDNYEKDYPIPKRGTGLDLFNYYDQDNNDPEYQAYWKKYFAFRSTIRFGAFYKFRRIFDNMLRQLNAACTATRG